MLGLGPMELGCLCTLLLPAIAVLTIFLVVQRKRQDETSGLETRYPRYPEQNNDRQDDTKPNTGIQRKNT